MRYTPRLNFILDQGVKRSIEIAQILREVLPPAKTRRTPKPQRDGNEEIGNEEIGNEEIGNERSATRIDFTVIARG